MPTGLPTSINSIDEARYAIQLIVTFLNKLESTNNGAGASMIGVEDGSGNNYWTGSDLETILDEIGTRLVALEP